VLEVTQQKVHTVPGSGFVSVTRILFVTASSTAQFTYDLRILFSTILQGDVSTLSEFFEACSVLSKKEDYKFCPGLDEKTYFDNFFNFIKFHIKSVRIWDKPFTRIDSKDCLLWHQLSKNSKTDERLEFEVLCGSCKVLICNLDHQKRRSDVSPNEN